MHNATSPLPSFGIPANASSVPSTTPGVVDNSSTGLAKGEARSFGKLLGQLKEGASASPKKDIPTETTMSVSSCGKQETTQPAEASPNCKAAAASSAQAFSSASDPENTASSELTPDSNPTGITDTQNSLATASAENESDELGAGRPEQAGEGKGLRLRGLARAIVASDGKVNSILLRRPDCGSSDDAVSTDVSSESDPSYESVDGEESSSSEESLFSSSEPAPQDSLSTSGIPQNSFVLASLPVLPAEASTADLPTVETDSVVGQTCVNEEAVCSSTPAATSEEAAVAPVLNKEMHVRGSRVQPKNSRHVSAGKDTALSAEAPVLNSSKSSESTATTATPASSATTTIPTTTATPTSSAKPVAEVSANIAPRRSANSDTIPSESRPSQQTPSGVQVPRSVPVQKEALVSAVAQTAAALAGSPEPAIPADALPAAAVLETPAADLAQTVSLRNDSRVRAGGGLERDERPRSSVLPIDDIAEPFSSWKASNDNVFSSQAPLHASARSAVMRSYGAQPTATPDLPFVASVPSSPTSALPVSSVPAVNVLASPTTALNEAVLAPTTTSLSADTSTEVQSASVPLTNAPDAGLAATSFAAGFSAVATETTKAEKSAPVLLPAKDGSDTLRPSEVEKNRQPSAAKKVKNSDKFVGIGDAKSVASMSTVQKSDVSTHEPASSRSAQDWITEGLSRLASGDTSTSAMARSDIAPQAKQLVDRIERTLDTLQARTERVVHFDVGDSKDNRLSVSMQLKAGVIQTTIHTASQELKTLLSRDWASSVASSLGGESALRVASPVFSSNGQSDSTDNGSTSQRQQQEPAHDQATSSHSAGWQNSRRSASASNGVLASTSTSASQVAQEHTSSNRILQAFA